jgi:hypothetical protein
MYAKLFESFWESSLNMNEAYHTRLAFQCLFTFCDAETGFVHCVNAKALALKANITEAEAEEALRILCSPDPDSTNPEHEGRRLEKVPGGYVVLNGPYYRSMKRKLDMNEQARLRMRRYREKKKLEAVTQDVTQRNTESTLGSGSGSLSLLKEKKVNKETVYPEDFVQFWNLYPKKQSKQDALKAWKQQKPDLSKILSALEWQIKSDQWIKENGQYIPQPGKYLREGKWDDQPTQSSEPTVSIEEGFRQCKSMTSKDL